MIKKILAALFVALILPFVLVSPIFAQQQRAGDNVVVAREETVDQDLFISGDNVTLAGTVNGDVFAAGGKVIIEGTVNGDLLAAGGTVDIRGRVAEDVRAIGGQVNISGEVGGNVSTAGGSVNITDGANISGSLANASGNLSVFAPIGAGITFVAGQASLGNNVGGDVLAGVGQLNLTPSAQIAGNLTYTSTTPAQIAQGAQVTGQITQKMPPERPATDTGRFLAGASLIATLISFLGSLVIGLLLLYFFPVFTKDVAVKVWDKPWLSLLIGFLAVILFPIIFIILLITVIGIPLSLILLALFLIFVYLAKIFVAIAIGQKLLGLIGWKTASYWALILGLIIYELLFLIPILGWIIVFLIIIIGLGAKILTLIDYYQRFRSKELV